MKLPWKVLTAALICCTVPAVALDIKDVTFKTENAGKVVFSHAVHLKKKSEKTPNISCKACHNDAMKKGERYTMAQMEKGKSCGLCHNGKKAFALAKCTACHKVKDVTFKVKQTGPVLFKHSVHLEKDPQCNTCHTGIFKTATSPPVSMAAMEKGKSCGACHNGKKAFALSACTKCHPVKELNFSVKATGDVPFSHKIHVDLYKCGECHTKVFPAARSKGAVSMAEMEKGKSCGVCHDGKSAFTVKENCAKCHPIKELNFVVKDAGDVAFSHKSHTGLYKCGECHTKIFAAARAKTAISMAEMEKGKSCGACHDGKAAFTVKENCGTCHKM